MNTFLINILLHALGSAPTVIDDLKAAFQENWNVPHVQQAMQGIQVLTKLAEDLAGFGQTSQPAVAPAVAAAAPAPPTSAPAEQTPAPVTMVPTPQPAPGPVI